jgi:hypothetical protein
MAKVERAILPARLAPLHFAVGTHASHPSGRQEILAPPSRHETAIPHPGNANDKCLG